MRGEEVDTLLQTFLLPFIMERMLSVIGLNEFWGVNLISWFPGVIGFWIPLPFDQVLEGLRLPRVSVINDLLNLIFFFSLDEVWGWSGIVWSMGCRFAIRR